MRNIAGMAGTMFLAITMTAAASAPAFAAPQAPSVVDKIAQQAITPDLAGNGDVSASAPSADTSITISSQSGEVSLDKVGQPSISLQLPASVEAQAPTLTSKSAVAYDDSTSAISTQVFALKDGRASIQTILEDKSAPKTFSYSVGDDLTPNLRPDGGVDLVDAAGRVVGNVESPWAFDAKGAPVATKYTAQGGTIIQVVTPSASTAYPITADPTFGHSYGIPTAYLNKAETKKATNAGDLGAVCGVIGLWSPPAGVVCGLNATALAKDARAINAKGKCAKLLLSPVSVKALEYTGGNCK